MYLCIFIVFNNTSFDVFPASVSRGVSVQCLLLTWFSSIPPFFPESPRRLALLHEMSSLSTGMPITDPTLFPVPQLVSGTQPTYATEFRRVPTNFIPQYGLYKAKSSPMVRFLAFFTRRVTPQTQPDKSGRCPSASHTPTNQPPLVKAHLYRCLYNTYLLAVCSLALQPM
jgi:hypothetical protein